MVNIAYTHAHFHARAHSNTVYFCVPNLCIVTIIKTHTYVHTYTHMHILTHTHAYTHIQWNTDKTNRFGPGPLTQFVLTVNSEEHSQSKAQYTIYMYVHVVT